MIVDCAAYQAGHRIEIDHHDIETTVAGLSGRDFLWIGINQPTQGEVERIGAALKLHPLAIEDMLEPHQRSKVEQYKDHVFISMRTVSYSDDDITTHEVNLAQGANFLLTVRHGGPSLKAARGRFDRAPEQAEFGPLAALHSVIDHMVDGYEDIAGELELDIDEVESSVFSDEHTHDSGRIYRLKREALEFRRAVAPLRLPLQRFSEAHVVAPAQPYFRDIVDHLIRVTDRIEAIESLLDNALNAHLAQLSVQQNEDMRKLTAGATIFAIPTAIAGIYGMNFQHMPELTWTFGYPLCLALMALLCGYVYWRFKRSGWL